MLFRSTADLDGAAGGMGPVGQLVQDLPVQLQHFVILRQGGPFQLLTQAASASSMLLKSFARTLLGRAPLLEEVPQALVSIRHHIASGLCGSLCQCRDDQGERVQGGQITGLAPLTSPGPRLLVAP